MDVDGKKTIIRLFGAYGFETGSRTSFFVEENEVRMLLYCCIIDMNKVGI